MRLKIKIKILSRLNTRYDCADGKLTECFRAVRLSDQAGIQASKCVRFGKLETFRNLLDLPINLIEERLRFGTAP